MTRIFKQLSIGGLLGGVIATLSLVLWGSANSAVADRSFRQLVLDDCAKAKEQLPLQEPADQVGLVDYLVDVIHLKFPNKVPPFSPPQFVNKWQDAGPSKIEAPYIDPSRVDPLRVTESAAERNARNCAVELLGMMGGVAASSLPDLVEYGSQDELDDQSRNRAQDALYAVAAGAQGNVSEETLERLLKASTGEGAALSRTVLMIVAPANWQMIIRLALSKSEVAVTDASQLIAEIFETIPELVITELGKILRGDESPSVSRVLEVLSRLGLAPAPLIPVIEERLFAPFNHEAGALNIEPEAQRSAAKILVLSGDLCAGTSESSFERAARFIDQDGVIGDAALQRIRCALLKGLVAAPRVESFRKSENPLVRERFARLAPLLSAKAALSTLAVLTEDPVLSVRVSAIRELSRVGQAQRNQATSILLKILTPISKRQLNSEDREVVKLSLSTLEKLGINLGWQGWGPVLKRLVLSYGSESSSTVKPSDTQRELSRVLALLSRQSLEIPKALMLSSKADERLIAARLIVLATDSNPQALSLLVPLLGDASPELRAYAFAKLAAEPPARLAPIIKQAIGSKQGRVRGVGLIMTSGQLKSDQTKMAVSWIEQAACLELLISFSQPAFIQEQLYQAAIQRVPQCLSELRPEWSDEVVSAWLSPKIDERRRELIVRSLIDLEPEQPLRLSVIRNSPQLGLSPQELTLLSKSSLDELEPEQALSLMPALKQYGARASDLIPQVSGLSGRFPTELQARCAVVEVLSRIDEEFDWVDYFKDEVSETDDGVGCVRSVEPSRASQALIKLLPEVPLRKQVRVLRRLAVTEGLAISDVLTEFLASSLSSSNEELRCQSTKVALRSGYLTPLAKAAVRRSLYGSCWEEIRGYSDPNFVKVAAEIEKTPANNLELTRASYIRRSAAPQR